MAITSAIANWIDTIGPSLQARSMVNAAASNTREGINFFHMAEKLVRYRVVGNGSHTLVLAVDAPVVIGQYDQLIDLLKNDFRVVVFELPGSGFSLPGTRYRFGFVPANDLVAKFLRDLNFGPYLLAFPCVSAYAAIDIANRYPDLVAGVVAMQAPAWNEAVKWKHARDPNGVLARPILGQLLLKVMKRKLARQWLRGAIGKSDMLPDFVKNTDHAFSYGAWFCLASAFQHYLTDTPPSLGTVRQPALIIWGEADRSHRHTDKTSTRQYFPDAQDLRFREAGHFPEIEEAAMFAAAVRHWARTILLKPNTHTQLDVPVAAISDSV